MFMKTFSPQEKEKLLALKGVGPTVVKRLEQIGYSDLRQLSGETALSLAEQVATLLRSSCWKNSPKARDALDLVIALAENESSLHD